MEKKCQHNGIHNTPCIFNEPKKLKEQVEAIKAFVDKSKAEVPNFNNAWFSIKDIPLKELEDYVEYINSRLEEWKGKEHLEYDAYRKCKVLQLSNFIDDATIFIYSKKCKKMYVKYEEI